MRYVLIGLALMLSIAWVAAAFCGAMSDDTVHR